MDCLLGVLSKHCLSKSASNLTNLKMMKNKRLYFSKSYYFLLLPHYPKFKNAGGHQFHFKFWLLYFYPHPIATQAASILRDQQVTGAISLSIIQNDLSDETYAFRNLIINTFEPTPYQSLSWLSLQWGITRAVINLNFQ